VIKERSFYNRWSCQSNSASLSVTLAKTHVTINKSLIYIMFALLVMMKSFCRDEITAFIRSTCLWSARL